MESDRATTALGVTIRVPATWTAEEGEIVHRWRGAAPDLISISRVPAPNRVAFDALVDNARSIAIEEGWEVEELPPSANGAVARRLSKRARSSPMTRRVQWYVMLDRQLTMFTCAVLGPAAAAASAACRTAFLSISLSDNPPPVAAGRRRIRLGRMSVSIDQSSAQTLNDPTRGAVLFRANAGDSSIEVGVMTLGGMPATSPDELAGDIRGNGDTVVMVKRETVEGTSGVFAEYIQPAQSEVGRVIHARYEFDSPEYVLIQCVASISDQAARARCVDRVTAATLAERP
ncbi:MAG: hypothetical protein JNK05_23590 [Myxococcales bacterium]|nr:hypothetical protein [Myxococcales bacterium]